MVLLLRLDGWWEGLSRLERVRVLCQLAVVVASLMLLYFVVKGAVG